jgi:hypothetical protein
LSELWPPRQIHLKRRLFRLRISLNKVVSAIVDKPHSLLSNFADLVAIAGRAGIPAAEAAVAANNSVVQADDVFGIHLRDRSSR